MRLIPALLFLLIASSSGASAQTVTGTVGDAVNTRSLEGGMDALSVGQTFRIPHPDEVFLHAISMGFHTSSDGGSGDGFWATLMEWNDATDRIEDPTIYHEFFATSPGAMEYVSFGFPGIQLRAAATYAFFLSFARAVEVQSLITPTDAYADGAAIHTWTSGASSEATFPATELAGSFWFVAPYDHGFTATFSSEPVITPEPATLLLLASGAAAVAGAARRRRTRGPADAG